MSISGPVEATLPQNTVELTASVNHDDTAGMAFCIRNNVHCWIIIMHLKSSWWCIFLRSSLHVWVDFGNLTGWTSWSNGGAAQQVCQNYRSEIQILITFTMTAKWSFRRWDNCLFLKKIFGSFIAAFSGCLYHQSECESAASIWRKCCELHSTPWYTCNFFRSYIFR